jgi:hypothetical protein
MNDFEAFHRRMAGGVAAFNCTIARSLIPPGRTAPCEILDRIARDARARREAIKLGTRFKVTKKKLEA